MAVRLRTRNIFETFAPADDVGDDDDSTEELHEESSSEDEEELPADLLAHPRVTTSGKMAADGRTNHRPQLVHQNGTFCVDRLKK